MKVVLPFSIKEKLRMYVESVDSEISGVGKIKISPDGNECRVIDIKILKQEVSGATASLDGQAIIDFSNDLLKSGESLEGWNMWWHSHNTMGVFWSGTDTDTMDENSFSMPFMLSLVTNKKSQYKARIDVYQPTHMFVDNAEVVVEYPEDISKAIIEARELIKKIDSNTYNVEDPALKEVIDNDIKEKVTEEKVGYKTYGHGSHSVWDSKKGQWVKKKEKEVNVEEEEEFNYNHNDLNAIDKANAITDLVSLNIPSDEVVINDEYFEELAIKIANKFMLFQIKDMLMVAETMNELDVLEKAKSLKDYRINNEFSNL